MAVYKISIQNGASQQDVVVNRKPTREQLVEVLNKAGIDGSERFEYLGDWRGSTQTVFAPIKTRHGVGVIRISKIGL